MTDPCVLFKPKNKISMYRDLTLAKIRQQYTLVFKWHKENGHTTIERIIQSNRSWNREYDDNLEEYKQALDMPHPENANLEEINSVAHKVVSGILEWNYQAKAGSDLVLGEVARDIMKLYEDFKKQEEVELSKGSFYAVTDYDVQSDYEYFEKAELIYKKVLLDNEKNIGGRVALADTNWEVQKLSNNKTQLFFRTPIALRLKEIQEEENLFQLALVGKISITNIAVR
jgi:hypothetical protein